MMKINIHELIYTALPSEFSKSYYNNVNDNKTSESWIIKTVCLLVIQTSIGKLVDCVLF